MDKAKHIILDGGGPKLWKEARAKLIAQDINNVTISDNLALQKILRGFLNGSSKKQ